MLAMPRQRKNRNEKNTVVRNFSPMIAIEEIKLNTDSSPFDIPYLPCGFSPFLSSCLLGWQTLADHLDFLPSTCA